VSAVIKLSSPATREFREIPVLYEDDHLLALDKPAGLPVSPDRSDPERPCLMPLLHSAIAAGKPWTRERGLTYLMNAHRLDPETSGVLLLAKNKPVLIALANLFGSEKPVNTFTALVNGSPPEQQFAVDAKIAPHPVKPGLMRVDSRHGKKSTTRFEVLEIFPRCGCALLKCKPLISRPHQIRVHLRHAGFPVTGDSLYGGKPLWLSRLKRDYRLKPGHEERPLIACAALHAEELSFPHPVTGAIVTITAPWPKDLKVAVKYLRLYGK
jgi:23S rRNA pseudouridine1911/1915/1917 synthase